MFNPENKPVDTNDETGRSHASGLPHELQSFEARLARLAPRDDRLDRQRLAFLAGQASMSAETVQTSPPRHDWRRHPAWPAAFAGMSALAATFLAILLSRPVMTESPTRHLRNFTASDRVEAKPMTTKTPDQIAGTLSPRSALYEDVEAMLSDPVDLTMGWPNAFERADRPTLTPTSWQEFSESPTTTNPPASSIFRRKNRGIQS
jgi:hypothetical protein